MTMDFSLKFLNTRISCSAPSADEYSLENLISADATVRSKGFLTEGFVRPPVNVDFTFSVPIDLYHIFFDTKVFSKQCCAFAVFLNCHPCDESSFVRVGIYNTKNEEHVHLISASLDKWYQYPVERRNFRNSLPGSIFEGRLRTSVKDALKNVRCLRIRLLRNVSTGGSGLKNVEVWGKIGDLAASEDKEILLESWQQHTHFLRKKQQAHLQSCISPEAINSSKPPEDSIEDIPDEFLDPITCDLMVTPMLLPSGHSVDITTLDKFNAAEMRYNRPPSNPFTGMAFTVDRKPIPNIALKSRIDRFVLLRHRVGNSEDYEETSARCRKPKSEVKSTNAQASSSSAKSGSVVKASTSISSNLADKNEKLDAPNNSTEKSPCRGFSLIKSGNSSANSASSTDVTDTFRGHRGLPQQISTRPARAAVSKRRFASTRPETTATSITSNSCNVPISRELFHSKPSRLIQGDGISPEFYAYNSENLLPCRSVCCKCRSREQLYIMSPCKHISCRSCLSNQDRSSIACDQCGATVHTTQITKHYI